MTSKAWLKRYSLKKLKMDLPHLFHGEFKSLAQKNLAYVLGEKSERTNERASARANGIAPYEVDIIQFHSLSIRSTMVLNSLILGHKRYDIIP